jgi:hypothetical protein
VQDNEVIELALVWRTMLAGHQPEDLAKLFSGELHLLGEINTWSHVVGSEDDHGFLLNSEEVERVTGQHLKVMVDLEVQPEGDGRQEDASHDDVLFTRHGLS